MLFRSNPQSFQREEKPGVRIDASSATRTQHHADPRRSHESVSKNRILPYVENHKHITSAPWLPATRSAPAWRQIWRDNLHCKNNTSSRQWSVVLPCAENPPTCRIPDPFPWSSLLCWTTESLICTAKTLGPSFVESRVIVIIHPFRPHLPQRDQDLCRECQTHEGASDNDGVQIGRASCRERV